MGVIVVYSMTLDLVMILPPIKDTLLPLDSFDKNRRQWKSNNILKWILDRKKLIKV